MLTLRQTLSTLGVFALATVARGQCEEANLVPNPEFANSSCRAFVARNGNLLDQYRVATPTDTEETVYEWFNARSPSTPDFYHECAGNINTDQYPGRASVRSPTEMNRQMTYRGGGYMGIILYGQDSVDSPEDNYREYISIELAQSLAAGETYRLSFEINAAGFAIDSAEYSGNTAHFNHRIRVLFADRVGAFFSPDLPVLANYPNKPGTFTMDVEPHVEHVGMISDTLGWTTISGTYVAAGGERYLTIGNFRDDGETNIQVHRFEDRLHNSGNRGAPNGDIQGFRAYAYALVDYVELRQLGPDAPVIDEAGLVIDEASGCGTADAGVRGLAVGPPGGPDAYEWRDASGTSVGSALDLGGVPAGLYTLTVTRAGCSDEAGPFAVGEPTNCCAIIIDEGGRNATPSGDCAPSGAITGIGATTSGTEAISYAWTDAAGVTVGTSVDLTAVIAGDYTLTVRAGDCVETAGPFAIAEEPCPPTCSITADASAVRITPTDCGARTGAIDGVVVGFGGPGTHRESIQLSWWWDGTGQLNDYYQASGGDVGRTWPATYGASPSGSQPDLYNGRPGAHFLLAQIDSCRELFGPFFVPEQGCPDDCAGTVDAGPDQTISSGATAALTATPTGDTPVGYSWTPAASLDDPSTASPQASPSSTTTYTVVVDFGDGCFVDDRVTVTVDGAACASAIDASPDRTINSGEAAPLSATATGSTPSSYSWTPAASLDDPGAREPVATPDATTTYTVTADFGAGCTATDEVTVTVEPQATTTVCLPTQPDVLILHTFDAEYGALYFDCFTGSGIDMNASYCSVSSSNGTNIGPPACMGDMSGYDLVMVSGLYSSFSDAFVARLTAYLDAGGSLFFMVDPNTASVDPNLRTQQESNINDLLRGQGFSDITLTNNGATGSNATPVILPAGSYTCPVGEVYYSTGGELGNVVGADQLLEVDGNTWQAYWNTPAGGRLGVSGEHFSAGTTRCDTENPGSGELIYNLMSPGCTTCCPDDLAVEAGPDQMIDAGESTALSATAAGGTPVGYTWTPAAGLDDPAAREPVASPSATTTYTVTADFGGGCTASDEVTVTVVSEPVADPCSRNLVPNHSFEEAVSETCLNNSCGWFGQAAESSVGWVSYNYSADYFEPASKGCTGTGWEPGQTPAEEPQDGRAFMGFQAYWPGSPPLRNNDPTYTTREFVGTELCCPLVAGVPYEIAGYFRQHPGNRRYTINGLGLRLDRNPRRSRNNCGPGATEVRDAHVWTDAMVGRDWTRVAGTVVADREYTHVLAGNFFRHGQITVDDAEQDAATGYAAYYNVDNLSVTPLAAWVANSNHARTVSIASGGSVELVAYGPGPYAWSGDGLDDPTAKRPVASPTATTTYAITVDLGCSTVTTEVTVVVDDSPCRLTLDSTTAVVTDATCASADGSIVGVTADSTSEATTYAWSDADGALVGATLDLSDVAPGNYTLTATDGACVVTVGPFRVGGDPTPSIDEAGLAIEEATCGGVDGALRGLAVTDASDAATYAWTDAAGEPVGTELDLVGVGAGAYAFTVVDGGCSAVAGPFSVVEDGAPVLDETNLDIANATCGERDGSITGMSISGDSPATSLSWTNDSGAVVGTELDLSGVPAGRYTLTATDGPCTDVAGPFELFEDGIPLLDAGRAVTAEADCDGNGGSVTGIFPVDPGLVPDYEWTDAPGSVVGDDLDLRGVPAGVYTLTATAGGCSESHGPYTVGQSTPPSVDEAGLVSVDANCGQADGSLVGLRVTATGPEATLVWVDGDGLAVATTLDLAGVPRGRYTLTVTDGACTATAGPFAIGEAGGVAIDTSALAIRAADCAGDGGAITGIRVTGASGAADPSWTDDDGRVVALGADLPAATEGAYTLSVVEGACSAEAGPFVILRDTCPPPPEVDDELAEIAIANTMTPNGDGDNDAFHVEGLEAFPRNRLTVYNRWGSPVYEAAGYLNDWRGDRRGQPLPEGTYYYALRLDPDDYAGRTLTGYITLLR